VSQNDAAKLRIDVARGQLALGELDDAWRTLGRLPADALGADGVAVLEAIVAAAEPASALAVAAQERCAEARRVLDMACVPAPSSPAVPPAAASSRATVPVAEPVAPRAPGGAVSAVAGVRDAAERAPAQAPSPRSAPRAAAREAADAAAAARLTAWLTRVRARFGTEVPGDVP
jgi:hypothetical protein